MNGMFKNDNLKITQIPLSHIIAEKLRQRIWSGEIQFGERLFETNLAEEMEVSRSSLREALQTMEFQGLVVNKARKGTFVTEFTADDMKEINEVRLILEIQAFVKAINYLTEDHYLELKKMVDCMKEKVEQEKWVELFDLDLKFHVYVVNLCGNSRMIKLYDLIQVQIRAFLTQLTRFYEQRKMLFWKEHDELLQEMLTGDAETVRRAIVKHIQLDDEIL